MNNIDQEYRESPEELKFQRALSNLPRTTFPISEECTDQDKLSPFLFNSDSSECNANLCNYIKHVVDAINEENNVRVKRYEGFTIYALKLLSSNMFVRNFELCIAKMLAMISSLSDIIGNSKTGLDGTQGDESVDIVEFCSLTSLILLKMKGSKDTKIEASRKVELIDSEKLFLTFQKVKFISVISKSICSCIRINSSITHYSSLKIGCDIIFEYLYLQVKLSEEELDDLTFNTDLISLLIEDLLSAADSEIKHHHSNWEEDANLVAYEEFKLLLLLNEQFIIRSFEDRSAVNHVFKELIDSGTSDETSGIFRFDSFLNLTVYYLNREGSVVVKILILKFLYLVFTTSFTAKLFYLNDLKILIDLFIRELLDIDCSSDNHESHALMVTYLKVLYPLLSFSQLVEVPEGYKSGILLDILRSIVVNEEFKTSKDLESNPEIKKADDSLSKLALRCLSVPCLKREKNRIKKEKHLDLNELQREISNSSISSKGSQSDLHYSSNNSSDSLEVFQRVHSLRATTKNEHNKTIQRQNTQKALLNSNNVFKHTNSTIFESPFNSPDTTESLAYNFETSEIVQELLSIPRELTSEDANCNIRPRRQNMNIALKGLKKPAPPPPPPPRRRRN